MMRVLVVDDKEQNYYLLSALLKGSGFEVETARHGSEALARARRHPPHLIISDLLMPVMDGYTLLRQWRADAGLRQIPFVVYTATYTEPEDERLAMKLGADAFILKPVEPEDFVARIKQVIAAAAAGKLARPQPPTGEEEPSFKQYSETLVRKLEQKTFQLTEANRALERDIAERRQVQLELAEREALLRTIIETEPECVHTVSREGRIVEMNRAGLAMLEAESLAQLQSRSALDFVAPEYQAIYRKLHERVLRGESGELEIESVGLNGARRWLEVHAAALAGGARRAAAGPGGRGGGPPRDRPRHHRPQASPSPIAPAKCSAGSGGQRHRHHRQRGPRRMGQPGFHGVERLYLGGGGRQKPAGVREVGSA